MEKLDIVLCVLACAKNDKYKNRLKEFVDSYGYKLQNKNIKAKVVFLVEDEERPDFLDSSYGWYNCPGLPLSCRLLKYLKDEPISYRWLMQVDDDSSTDIDKTMELLEQFYDHEDCMLLMGGRNTDLEMGQQNVVRLMGLKNFFFGSSDINKFDTTPYFIHAWEPSIFSGRAVEKIKAWSRLHEFYDLCNKHKPIFGDQVPYVAAKFSKVPIVECLFMSPFSKAEEYSAVVPNGRFSHIHYVTEKWSGYELLKRRMMESKGKPLPVTEGEPDMWEFWGEESDSKRLIGIMTFKEDKTVGTYKNSNEAYWDRIGPKFILMDSNKKPTTVMDMVSEDEYQGKFIANPRVTHRIKRVVSNPPRTPRTS